MEALAVSLMLTYNKSLLIGGYSIIILLLIYILFKVFTYNV